MDDGIRDRRNTKVVIFCAECEFCKMSVYDYTRTGEYPYDPYLLCSKLYTGTSHGGQTAHAYLKVHADDYCSQGKLKTIHKPPKEET